MSLRAIKKTIEDLVNIEMDNISNQQQLEIAEDLIEVLEKCIELTEKDNLTETEEKILERGLEIVQNILIPVLTKGRVDKTMFD